MSEPRVVTVYHDPFARFSLVRQAEPAMGTCTECGAPGVERKDGRRLFRYGTERDDRPGRIEWQREQFCGVSCMRAYNA